MKGKRRIKIFVGYKIDSEYHDINKLKEALGIVKKEVESKANNWIEFQYGGEFSAGQFLFSEVLSAIRNCEIAILDISENNPNVLIEVGMAYGNNKFVVLLKNKLSNKQYEIPSDIGAFIYILYENNEALTDIDTCNRVAQSVLNYLKAIPIPILFFKSLWGFNENDAVYIVCPELEEPEKRQEPEEEEFLYLGKYGDIDSFIVMYTSLSKLYPQLNIKFCTGEEFDKQPGNPYAENLILIGGPDYNRVTRVFMKHTPFEFLEKDEVTILRHQESGKEFESKFVDYNGIEEITDYGFFLKISNPNNPNKKVVMINGIHTYGVYGAAKCFSMHDEHEIDIPRANCKDVIDELGDDPNFTVILEVKSINKKIGVPKISKRSIISL